MTVDGSAMVPQRTVGRSGCRADHHVAPLHGRDDAVLLLLEHGVERRPVDDSGRLLAAPPVSARIREETRAAPGGASEAVGGATVHL